MDREQPYTHYEITRMREQSDLYYELKEKQMITKIEASSFTGKTFQSKYGLMYVHSVTINGEVGSANAKTQMPEHFKAGTTVEVERTEDEFGVKFKISKPKEQQGNTSSGGKSPETQLQITRQSSLKAALDYYNLFNNGKIVSPQEIMSLADEFTAWVIK